MFMGLDDPCRGFTSINEGEDNCNDLALLAKHGSKILMFSGILFFDTLIRSHLTALLGHEVVSKRMKQHHTALRVQAHSMVEQCCMLVIFDLSEALLSVHRCCLSLHCWKSVCTINMVSTSLLPFPPCFVSSYGFCTLHLLPLLLFVSLQKQRFKYKHPSFTTQLPPPTHSDNLSLQRK